MPAALKVLSGTLRSRILVLPSPDVQGRSVDGATFLVGRSLEADLILNGPAVEDRHVVVVPEGATHRLVPVAARRTTWLGERVLDGAAVLRDGDRIRIGNHLLEYVSPWRMAPLEEGSPGQSPCAACGEPLGPQTGSPRAGVEAPQTLWLGGEAICPRCVDRRLHVDRDLGSYRILRKIGTNDEEVTYLAVDLESNRRVAVRILKADKQADPRVFRRFLVRALAGMVLDHRNYLTVEAIRSSGGITYAVLEHVEQSVKLEALVRDGSPLAVSEAIYVSNQLAEVLRYAREKNLVVAKRKKSGVLVDKSFWVKVLAFDVTRALEEEVARTDAFRDLAERSGADPGALARAELGSDSEEEARLGQLASEFAEVYSVGRILYQLLTGKPFGPRVLALVRRAHEAARANGTPPEGPLAEQPLPVLALLDRVLVPKGPDRIRTLDAFTRASKAAYVAAVGS